MARLEGTIAVPGGNVWFKRVGGGAGLPLLAVHGGPGLPHNYISSLARLADEREVIFWDQLGCGNSEKPSNAELWTMERSVAEMNAVVHALDLNDFHVFGNSWGGMLAQQYVLDVPSGAVSLTISNSIASIPQFSEMVARLKDEPFALISISADAEKKTLTDFLAKERDVSVPCSSLANGAF